MISRVLVLFVLLPVINTEEAKPKNIKFPLWKDTWVDKLRQNLLLKYDKFSRPAQHYDTTTVFVFLEILHADVDNKKSILSVNAWVRMDWNDEKLKWSPEDYGGVEEISVAMHEIWQPDLYLYNSALHGVEHYESRQCIVRQDGKITWIIPTVFHSYCDFNYILWPFETNTCVLTIGSWSHNGDEIDVRLSDKGVNLQHYTAGEWKVQNVTAHRHVRIYTCCPEPYIMLDYEIKLTRSSELYYHVIFVASIPIIFLVLITFWLRPQSEMKLILIICALIIDVLFLLYFGYRVPARTNNIPLIVRFFSGCLCQMTVSIIISGFVIHISTSSYDIPVPRRIRALLFGKMSKYLGLHGIIREIESEKMAEFEEINESQTRSLASSISGSDDGERQCIISESKNVRRLEWILLATAIDRLSFILFCIIFCIIAIAYIRINSDAFTKSFSIVNLPSSKSENFSNTDYF